MVAEVFPSTPVPAPDPYAGDPVFDLHLGGKIEVTSSVKVTTTDELSRAYTPWRRPGLYCDRRGPVAGTEVHVEVQRGRRHHRRHRGTGLGDIGPAASLPVMEGKALLFKEFGGVDSVPIALDCTDVDEFVETVVRMAPSFGGINLEDISAPRCFEIERRLKERLDIPVFHDDQHGTAVVVLAALRNALRY